MIPRKKRAAEHMAEEMKQQLAIYPEPSQQEIMNTVLAAALDFLADEIDELEKKIQRPCPHNRIIIASGGRACADCGILCPDIFEGAK